jgi:hypothetical protein
MPLVILHHLLNVSVRLANKGGFKQKKMILYVHPCIIIIGETAISRPKPSSEDSKRLHPVFTSLDFTTVCIFTEQGHLPSVQPLT